ncbi:MAG: bifunctional enoyl-CoA hydratase/phosphate acetyltransferase [Bacteroidales bacterium]
MLLIKNLSDLLKAAKNKQPKKMVIACAAHAVIMQAVKYACEENIIEPVLLCNQEEIEKIASSAGFSLSKTIIIHTPYAEEACQQAVNLIRSKQADILMKGMVSTSAFLKPIVNRDNGLTNKKLISHFALFEIPGYHKLLGIADVAINISPDFSEKTEILKNSVEIFHKLGIKMPKIAVIAAVETVNLKMEATVHAAMLCMMNKRNQITGCIVEGPLAIDNAISRQAAESKNIAGEVAGDADFLLAPDLNSGNILYKALNFMGGATSASIVAGASVPIVLTSRADSETSILMSIALAAITAH